MDHKQLEQLKQELEQQKEQLVSSDLVSEPDLNKSIIESTGELSSYDNHPADMGSEVFERSLTVALNEHEQKLLDDIEAALHRIEEGIYGKCLECGAQIPFERLQANPAAAYCIEHQEVHDRMDTGEERSPKLSDIHIDRPAEEDILSPPFVRGRSDPHEDALDDVEGFNDRTHKVDPAE
ncbi:TraR/DksA C4-type zinc finger protein [Aneurinibacillus sp. Ricciae_BoGa-3]|uniref:TraR/DksA C4-type zinc finger protein n=1 Tax=Aneurinibacillus sp. Ricciae_BoGa-3 TaxID=3022697 RepID=UPI002341BA6C|nr:TraR/DksA C4-type zinc finger protein [Aneurinibacillus sp. Ricciae_BoGa-3]WCK52443.1 TraR/DksA C4-type zinc finger protein [Aneurinibacillus sp. Ricciae_BoGa-3]